METTFQVQGMHCRSCEIVLKEVLEEHEGIHSAIVSQQKEMASVIFDNTKVSEEKIKDVIRKEGYKVR